MALHAAASTAERVSFRTLNRATGNQVRREYVDAETGEPVGADNQVKGYETAKDRYVVLTPEEMASAVPESDKTLNVEAFLACGDIDTTYFDRPYFLAPADAGAAEAFGLIREGLRKKRVAALARAVLFRRVRTVLIRAQGPGLMANTLNYDYEVRPAAEAFDSLPEPRIEPEMLDLARHIIATRSGAFDPSAFEDRYDAALAELVKAKAEGRAIEVPERPAPPPAADLLEALRQSAGAARGKPAGKPRKSAAGKPAAAPRRKAG